jgi:hypothetical protein
MKPQEKSHHHRGKRFHIARQALGFGYRTFDVPARFLPARPVAASGEEPTEPISEPVLVSNLTKREMWICGMLLFFLVLMLLLGICDLMMGAIS